MDRPNVIVIICDQMRGDCLGASEHPVVQTPNIDYLAACGTRFANAYSAVPSCLPARATLWTAAVRSHVKNHAGRLEDRGSGLRLGPAVDDAHAVAGGHESLDAAW